MTSIIDPLRNTINKGWVPQLVGESQEITNSDGTTTFVQALKLNDWIAGSGTKPTEAVGKYIGRTDYVSSIADAYNWNRFSADDLTGLLSGVIVTGHIVAGSITTELMANLAITAAKLANQAVIDRVVSFGIDPRKLNKNTANNVNPATNSVPIFNGVVNDKGQLIWGKIGPSQLSIEDTDNGNAAANKLYGKSDSNRDGYFHVSAKHFWKDDSVMGANTIPIVKSSDGQMKFSKADYSNIKDYGVYLYNINTSNEGTAGQVLSKTTTQQGKWVNLSVTAGSIGYVSGNASLKGLLGITETSAPRLKVQRYSTLTHFYYGVSAGSNVTLYMRETPNNNPALKRLYFHNSINAQNVLKKGSIVRRWMGSATTDEFALYRVTSDPATSGSEIYVTYDSQKGSGGAVWENRINSTYIVDVINNEDIVDSDISNSADIGLEKLDISGTSSAAAEIRGGTNPKWFIDYANQISKNTIPNYAITKFGNYVISASSSGLAKGQIHIDTTNRKIYFRDAVNHSIEDVVNINSVIRLWRADDKQMLIRASSKPVKSGEQYSFSYYDDGTIVGVIDVSAVVVSIDVAYLDDIRAHNIKIGGTKTEGQLIGIDASGELTAVAPTHEGEDTANKKFVWLWSYLSSQTDDINVNTLVLHNSRVWVVTREILQTNTTIRGSSPGLYTTREYFEPAFLPDVQFALTSGETRYYRFGETDSGDHEEAVVAFILDSNANKCQHALVIDRNDVFSIYTPAVNDGKIDFADATTYNRKPFITLQGTDLQPTSHNLRLPTLSETEVGNYTFVTTASPTTAGKWCIHVSGNVYQIRIYPNAADKYILDEVMKVGMQISFKKVGSADHYTGRISIISKTTNVYYYTIVDRTFAGVWATNNTNTTFHISDTYLRPGDDLDGANLDDATVDAVALKDSNIPFTKMTGRATADQLPTTAVVSSGSSDIEADADIKDDVIGQAMMRIFGRGADKYIETDSQNDAFTARTPANNTDLLQNANNPNSVNNVANLVKGNAVNARVGGHDKFSESWWNDWGAASTSTATTLTGNLATAVATDNTIYKWTASNTNKPTWAGKTLSYGYVFRRGNNRYVIWQTTTENETAAWYWDTTDSQWEHLGVDNTEHKLLDMHEIPDDNKLYLISTNALNTPYSRICIAKRNGTTITLYAPQHANPALALRTRTVKTSSYISGISITRPTNTELFVGTDTADTPSVKNLTRRLKAADKANEEWWNAWGSITTNSEAYGSSNLDFSSNTTDLGSLNAGTGTLTENTLYAFDSGNSGIPSTYSDIEWGIVWRVGTIRYALCHRWASGAGEVHAFKYVNSAWTEIDDDDDDLVWDMHEATSNWQITSKKCTHLYADANNKLGIIKKAGQTTTHLRLGVTGSGIAEHYQLYKTTRTSKLASFVTFPTGARHIQTATTTHWNTITGNLTSGWADYSSNYALPAVQIGAVTDYLEFSMTAVMYFGAGVLDPIGIEVRLQYATSSTQAGTYSAWANPGIQYVDASSIIFRSKIASGGKYTITITPSDTDYDADTTFSASRTAANDGTQYRDYEPRIARTPKISDISSSLTANTWIKVKPQFRMPDTDFNTLAKMYGYSARVLLIPNKVGLT